MFYFFFFNDTATTEIYTLSLHDALPICPCLLSLYLQPHSIFGLQRRPGSRPAHRFGRDRECSRLCVPEAAQDLRCLVEDGKSKKGNRSTGVTGERGLGRILDQRASGGCVN